MVNGPVNLFSPLTIRSLVLRNRVFVSPMCQYSATDGVPSNWHLVHLGSRAVGGAALVMAEATSVTPEGRISLGDTGIWNDQQAGAFAPIAQFIREQGAAPAIQLAHAGRKASTAAPWNGGAPLSQSTGGWIPVAPSAIPFAPGYSTPSPLSESDLSNLVDAFAHAAKRSARAGFQVVEIHAAHGYLLHEFLSPLCNQRTDQYGGSLANRMRFPLRVASAVRNAFPNDLPVFVRISASDWVVGGWDDEQSVAFAKELKNLGIDLVDCSSGGAVPDAQIPVAPGYQVPFADRIRREAQIMTGAVGLITEPAQANEIVSSGRADTVFLARQLLRDPYWPAHAARALGAERPWPKQYGRA